jgi:hypothetical protein
MGQKVDDASARGQRRRGGTARGYRNGPVGALSFADRRRLGGGALVAAILYERVTAVSFADRRRPGAPFPGEAA